MAQKEKSPTKEEILNNPETQKNLAFNMTRLFFAETPEAVDAYIKAGLKINHKDITEDTALDFCISRVVRNINTYEDSDNQGAVLAMINHGGKCNEDSLHNLQEAKPEFYKTVKEAMTAYNIKQQKLMDAMSMRR